MSSALSVVIPTYGRNQVLCDTLDALLGLDPGPSELLVIDQSIDHDQKTRRRLDELHGARQIRLLRLAKPSTVDAMNAGLLAARGEIVLFLDDDIIPGSDIFSAHVTTHEEFADAWAVAGQVIQPGGSGKASLSQRHSGLREDLSFQFDSVETTWVRNVMAGNLSVKREKALLIGGFDAQFTPPVAYRFETEFAKRIIARGGRIRFEPSASIRHLRALSGGTRSQGGHLTSASPVHGVGDYYYALRCGHGQDRLLYMLGRPFREVRTKFHMRHPWYVPLKFIGELRAMAVAIRLHRQGPRLLAQQGDTTV